MRCRAGLDWDRNGDAKFLIRFYAISSTWISLSILSLLFDERLNDGWPILCSAAISIVLILQFKA
jgi:hypothetical protein